MANRYPLIVDETIKEIVAGDTLVADNLLLSGTTPTLTIGDAGAEDTKIVFDGNAQDFYIGLDDSADDLVIGLGSAVGTTPAISIDENQQATFTQNIVVSGTVDGVDIATRDALLTSAISDVALRATIANPTLTGTPAAPTASGSTNTTQLATTAFVQQELTTLIGGAPSTLNDLNELAAAINDDANYNSTLTTALATKLPLAGGTMTGTLTANAGVVVDNITIDGTEIDLSSGDLTIDVAGNIKLDADDNGEVRLLDGGTQYLYLKKDSNTAVIQNVIADGDIAFRGTDDSSVITALTLDMSAAGAATFNDAVKLGDSSVLSLGAGSDIEIHSDGTNGTIGAQNGNLTLDVAGDIILDSDAANWRFKDAGTSILEIGNPSGPSFYSPVSNADILFKGNDGGSTITALTLDMSDAGTAIFGGYVKIADSQRLVFGAGSDLSIYHDGADSVITDTGTGNLLLCSSDLYIRNAANDETTARFTDGGAAKLYYANAEKLATVTGGVDITGNMEADNITIAGAQGSDGQVLTSTGSGVAWEDAGGGAYSSWLVKTANFTCASGDQLICNHASTAFTITLPTGAAGATVVIANAGAATVTIGRNSSNINSAAADGTLPQGNSVQLVYVDSTIGWFEV